MGVEVVGEGETKGCDEWVGGDFMGVVNKDRLPALYILPPSLPSSLSASSLLLSTSCLTTVSSSSSSSSPDIIEGTVTRKEFLPSSLPPSSPQRLYKPGPNPLYGPKFS
jgi:hypothetical protein